MFDPIENQIKRAEHAINDLSKNPNECEWFQVLLDMLKDEKEVVCDGKGEDSAAILFSGGTTGTSKGILLTNLNFNALAMQTIAASGCFAPGDTMISVMPVFHGVPQLMTRNLLYTAVTRAKKLAVLVGSERILMKMVDNNRELERFSSLGDMICDEFEKNI